MTKEERVGGFLAFKAVIETLSIEERNQLFSAATAKNAWYTEENIALSIQGITELLTEKELRSWIDGYTLPKHSVSVGIIMAGNIPLVGFQDLICVLLAGHKAVIKLSSQDDVLPRALLDILLELSPGFSEQIEIVEKLTQTDAVIATGSDNSSRYFKKYFGGQPHIIRKNRTSVAVLTGNESVDELSKLSDDIFSYFGLGCRNVAKLFIPADFKMEELIPSFENKLEIANHPKYFNNYEYNKAIYLVNRVDHLDNGFALFRETTELVSPLAVVFYERYNSLEEIKELLNDSAEKIQCVVGIVDLGIKMVPFGQAQHPKIYDYADNVDTMKFLCDL